MDENMNVVETSYDDNYEEVGYDDCKVIEMYPEKKTCNKGLVALAATGISAAVVGIVVLVKRHKKKKAQKVQAAEDDYDDEEDDDFFED